MDKRELERRLPALLDDANWSHSWHWGYDKFALKGWHQAMECMMDKVVGLEQRL